jgi:hypothetical protein
MTRVSAADDLAAPFDVPVFAARRVPEINRRIRAEMERPCRLPPLATGRGEAWRSRPAARGALGRIGDRWSEMREWRGRGPSAIGG